MGRPEGEGEEEKEQRARVRSGLGRSRDLASDWEAASKPSTRRAGGGRVHDGGETRDQVRDMGPRGGTWAADLGGCLDGF